MIKLSLCFVINAMNGLMFNELSFYKKRLLVFSSLYCFLFDIPVKNHHHHHCQLLIFPLVFLRAFRRSRRAFRYIFAPLRFAKDAAPIPNATSTMK